MEGTRLREIATDTFVGRFSKTVRPISVNDTRTPSLKAVIPEDRVGFRD